MQIAEQLNTALAGRYVIKGEIGRGGTAIVYQAHDLRHDRSVALKVLKPELGEMLGVTRFLAEIKVTANLQHPNLLPLFDSGEANGLLFYVMPYIEEKSLRGRLAREKQLPIDEAVHIAASVAEALKYAHAHGVIHRDLKPENILLRAGQPIVADFGIALAVSRAAGTRITLDGISLGTPQYMSPEQATGDRVVDARSDVYSLAAVLYEMLTGEPPFTGNTSQAIIGKILTEDIPAVRQRRPSVPEHVADAVAIGLEKLPADRWATAQAFAEALTGTRHVGTPTSRAERHKPHAAFRLSVVRLSAFTAVAAVAASVVVAAWPGSRPEVHVSWFDLTLPDSAAPQSESETSMALSPDGSTMAYVGSPTRSLFIRSLEDLTPRRLAGTEGALCPSFSPDGRWIAFTMNGRLKKIPLRGGTAITVADSAGECGVWTDRNEILFDVRKQLYRVSADGGPVSVVARWDTSRRIGLMVPSQALPGGNAAVISVSEGFAVDYQLGVVSLPGGLITKLTPKDGPPRFGPRYSRGYVVFKQNSSLIARPFSLRTLRFTGPEVRLIQDSVADFSISENGTLAYTSRASSSKLSLVAVSRGGAERVLGGNADNSRLTRRAVSPLDTAWYSWPRLSPDGKRVAVDLSTGAGGADVWIYDIVSRALTRLTYNTTGIMPSGWSADGESVLFSTSDDGSFDGIRRVVAQRWDGGSAVRDVIRFPRFFFDPSIGPAHGFVAFVVFSLKQKPDIWIAPLDSPQAARPLIATNAVESQPRLSPDGKLLAYISNETGHFEVYIRPVLGRASLLRVSTGGGIQPKWSADGRQLYYRTLAAGPVAAGVAGAERGPEYMIRATIARGSDLSVTYRDTLFRDVYVHHDVQNYDVFPGGKELLMIRSDPNPYRAAMVLSWPELLRQRVSGAPTR
jgi:serine/threonine protein kinase